MIKLVRQMRGVRILDVVDVDTGFLEEFFNLVVDVLGFGCFRSWELCNIGLGHEFMIHNFARLGLWQISGNNFQIKI